MLPKQSRQSRMFSISNIFYIPLLGILFVYVINTFIGKSHIFSEEDIIRITRENIGEGLHLNGLDKPILQY